MSPDDVAKYLNLFLAIAASIAAVGAFIRWGQKSLKREILEQIIDSTSQIKTDANGGQSLNDVNRAVKDLAAALHAHTDAVRDMEHKRDAQIERLHYEIALVKRVASNPALNEE